MRLSFINLCCLFLTLFLILPVGRANLLDYKPGTQTLDSTLLMQSAQWPSPSANLKLIPVDLKAVSAGLRAKKILFVNVKVYVAQLFVENSDQWTEKISTLEKLKTIALRMNFLREVDAEKIETSFREGLKANKINLDQPAIQTFLKAVAANSNIKKNEIMTLVGAFSETTNGQKTETLYFESTSGTVTSIEGPNGFLQQVFSIWFGETPELALSDLKKSLLTPR